MSAFHQFKSISREGEADLLSVLTISEAARRWGLWHTSIRRAIDSGRLCARKSEGTWLISKASMVNCYGPPRVLDYQL